MLIVASIAYMSILGIFLLYFIASMHQFCKQGSNLSEIKNPEITSISVIITILALAPTSLRYFGLGDMSGYFSTIQIGALPVLMGVTLLSIYYFVLKNKLGMTWFKGFYYTGIVFTILTSIILTTVNATYYDARFLTEIVFSPILIVLLLITICTTIIAIFGGLIQKLRERSDFNMTANPKPFTNFAGIKSQNKDMLAHYQAAGLSPIEIENFRQEMAKTRDHILSIEKQFNQTAKMRAIELAHNTVKVSHSYFKDIVKEPQRRGQAGHFTIQLIPQLDDLLNKYNEINGHVAKNKQTYMILEKSAQTIDRLCQEICDDYIQFHSESYRDLEDGIRLADRSLNRQTPLTEEADDFSQDTIDDLLKFDQAE